MTADLSALLDRLEAAAAAATPGTWQVSPDWQWGIEARGEVIASAESPADTDAIVAAVNALPTLIAELRAHQAAVQAVRELAAAWLRDGSAPAQAIEVREIVGRSHLRAAVAALDPKETS